MNTIDDFYDYICSLPDNYKNRDLEEYLLALYPLIVSNKSTQPSLELFAQLFTEAFTAPCADFDSTWLNITHAPDENIMSHKFTNPAISNYVDKSAVAETTGVSFTLSVLEFQLSELHKMRGKQLKNDMRYFGIDSATGNRWYNFDPFTNLECGVRCMLDGNDEPGIFIPTWKLPGQILEYGRIYE